MEIEKLQRFDRPTISPSKQKSTMSKLAKQEKVVSKQGRKRITRSQTVALEDKTVAKGNLEDILHAIDIEETPIVQAKDIDEGGQKLKKAKSVKKLEFEGEDAGFMFQARNPMTRHARKLLESSKEVHPATDMVQPPREIIDFSSPAEKDLVRKPKKGKEKVIEKIEFELLEEQLRLANHEIVVMRKEERKHNVQKVQFENMKEVWEEQVDIVSKTLDNTQQLIKWTMPLRKEVKNVRRMNLHMKSTNIKLKDQVKDLEEQLELIHEELEKKGLKMTVVEEPIAQLIINEEETPQDSQFELVYVLKGQWHVGNNFFTTRRHIFEAR